MMAAVQQESVTAPAQLLAQLHDGALPRVPATCVVSYFGGLNRAMKQRREHRSLRVGGLGALDVFDGEPALGLVRGLQGAPAAAVQVEMLLAIGFRELVVVGPAGHAFIESPVLELGDVVLAEGALIYEGTSRHYGVTTDRVAADPSPVASRLERHGIAHRRGVVATTDALFRETPAWIAEIVERGALVMDMEISALLSVCGHHGATLHAVLIVSDRVGVNGWEIGFAHERVSEAALGLTALWCSP